MQESPMSLRPQEINRAKLPLLFKREFELCNVSVKETNVLLTDLKVRPVFIEAAFAAEALGAPIAQTHSSARIRRAGAARLRLARA
jgi:2,5-dihydroxypyridine 5,6-dioxygenase